MQNSPNSKLTIELIVNTSKSNLWKVITDRNYLEKWFCNDCSPNLEAGSSWEPLGINFWGGDLYVLFSSPDNMLALRWHLENSQSMISLKLDEVGKESGKETTRLTFSLEYPTKGSFGFPENLSSYICMKLVWRYYLTKLKLVAEMTPIFHRVDILKPEGNIIEFIYQDKNITSQELLNIFKDHTKFSSISLNAATNPKADGYSITYSSDTTSNMKPESFKILSDEQYQFTVNSGLNLGPLFLNMTGDSIVFSQSGFNGKAELQNIAELEWSTLIYCAVILISSGQKIDGWFKEM